jgi:hypothetical protein
MPKVVKVEILKTRVFYRFRECPYKALPHDFCPSGARKHKLTVNGTCLHPCLEDAESSRIQWVRPNLIAFALNGDCFSEKVHVGTWKAKHLVLSKSRIENKLDNIEEPSLKMGKEILFLF